MSAPNTPENTVHISYQWKPVTDWSILKGHKVEIHIGGRIADQGQVEDVTADGSVLWLMLDGATGRRIIENQPGTYIRRGNG